MAGMTTDVAECLNCGSPLAGAYCSQCGQKALHADPTFLDLARELTHELVSVDGKVVRTPWLLLPKPGFLTLEYDEGRRARYPSPIRLLGASRELIEWQVRNRVTALDNVELLERCEAVGLLGDHDRGGVTGVRLRSPGGHAEVTGPDTDVPADFVVDASGRGSRAPRWRGS